MKRLEQWGDFRHEQGPRTAEADRASLQSASNAMTLTGKAKVRDEAGSTSADSMSLDQNSGAFTAEWFAIVMTNPVMRVVANFILRVTKTTRRRMFPTEAEAIRWLDERARESGAP